MNARPPSPEAQFSEFLSRFPPEIVALVQRCLPKLRRAFPGAYELVYEYSNSLVVGFGVSDRGYESIVALAIFPNLVRLYFDKSLPDPKGLLEGSGGKVRSVVVKAASDLDSADIQALIKAAIKNAGAKFPSTLSNPMIIKSVAKKKATPVAKKTATSVAKKKATPVTKKKATSVAKKQAASVTKKKGSGRSGRA